MQQRIEYIDFARGYAIFTIVCYHALQQAALSPLWQKAIVFGGTGVHLFFLLSGFGLAWSAKQVSPWQFYRRRMIKVWLPYVMALTLSAVAAMIWHIFPDGWDAWLAGVALYQMFSAQYIESFGGHFWFISTIIQFYLVFPLLLRWQQRLTPRLFLLLSFSLSMGWWLLLYFSGKSDLRNWNSFFLQFVWEFALGMVLAQWIQQQETPRSAAWRKVLEGTSAYWWLTLPLGLLSTALMIGMILKLGEPGRIFNDVPALIGYTALSMFVYHLGQRWIPPVKQFFTWVGSFSYGLYLTHVLVLHLCLKAWGISVITGLTFFAFLLFALLAGWLFEQVNR